MSTNEFTNGANEFDQCKSPREAVIEHYGKMRSGELIFATAPELDAWRPIYYEWLCSEQPEAVLERLKRWRQFKPMWQVIEQPDEPCEMETSGWSIWRALSSLVKDDIYHMAATCGPNKDGTVESGVSTITGSIGSCAGFILAAYMGEHIYYGYCEVFADELWGDGISTETREAFAAELLEYAKSERMFDQPFDPEGYRFWLTWVADLRNTRPIASPSEEDEEGL